MPEICPYCGIDHQILLQPSRAEMISHVIKAFSMIDDGAMYFDDIETYFLAVKR